MDLVLLNDRAIYAKLCSSYTPQSPQDLRSELASVINASGLHLFVEIHDKILPYAFTSNANIMAPIVRRMVEVTKPIVPNTLIVEAWAQGFMVGSILIMLCTTISNYRRGVLLHKLIVLEVNADPYAITLAVVKVY